MGLQRRQLHADPRFHADRTLIAVALALVGCAAPAAAQVSVEVSPLRLELQAGPGSTTTQAITITNAGTEPVRVRGTVTDWDLAKDGAPQFESAVVGGPYSATGWVRIAPPEQVIEPGKAGIVRFNLTVPAGVQPAGYRTGILFDFSPAAGDLVAKAREVQFKSRIASLIYVNVGQPPAAVELTDLASRVTGAQTQIVATLKNTGKRSVRTKGSLTIFDASGKSVADVAVPDVPVLPESERDVVMTVVDPDKSLKLPPGDYRVELKIDVGSPALIVGETTLKIPR